MSLNYTLLATNGTILTGWQSPHNDRGSWDIVWSSLQTLALCAWVSVCTNAPSPVGGRWDIFLDKIYFVLLTLLGPEFIFMLALGQWQAAKTSCQHFRKAGYKEWTLVHSFYADMGGIHVKADDFPSFPVNSRQFLYLLQHKHIDMPPLTRDYIEGLGKSDTAAKFITIFQTISFVLSTAARFQQGLKVTTLEMTVLANIFCTSLTYLCWWSKPTDVSVTQCYRLRTNMSQIVYEAGPVATGEYRATPLDFVGRREWVGSLLWNYFVNILRRLHLVKKRGSSPPAQRFSSFDFPRPESVKWIWLVLGITIIYTAFFLPPSILFYFPSLTEVWLWRVFAGLQMAVAAIGPLWEIKTFNDSDKTAHADKSTELVDLPTTWRPTRAGPLSSLAAHQKPGNRTSVSQKVHEVLERPCNNELTGNFPSMNVQLSTVLWMSTVCAIYVLCRLVLLALDVVTLRTLPASAFVAVDWSKYLPWL